MSPAQGNYNPKCFSPFAEEEEEMYPMKVSWDAMSSCVDADEIRTNLEDLTEVEPITTMMVRNIPRRQTQEQLEAHLRRTGFKGEYDVLYLPYCFKKKQNLGY